MPQINEVSWMNMMFILILYLNLVIISTNFFIKFYYFNFKKNMIFMYYYKIFF